jgi:hypothetical protein
MMLLKVGNDKSRKNYGSSTELPLLTDTHFNMDHIGGRKLSKPKREKIVLKA